VSWLRVSGLGEAEGMVTQAQREYMEAANEVNREF
jgi:hypothetical protein